MTDSLDAVPLLFPWWKPVSLEVGQCWRYTVGPLALYFHRQAGEWLLASEQSTSAEDHFRTTSTGLDCLPDTLETQRYIFRQSPGRFCLQPALLDRPVVVKTRQPVSIPSGEQTVFYISSPICIRINLQQPDFFLQEFQVQRLSDTWFGPSTQHGELCYADRTQARHSKSDVPLRPHRAVTPITIDNNSGRMLTIDKLSIPVPYLAVYGLPNGTLWTDPVSLVHDGVQALTRFRIGTVLPEGVRAEHRLGEPHRQMERQGFIRAFTDIFTD